MKLLIIVGFLVVFFVVMLLIFQHKLIYFPRSYDANSIAPLLQRVSALEYYTDEGKQVAFYLPPRRESQNAPERVWILFGGNASLALNWQDFAQRYPDERAGFLLIDYPGYGKCEGKASPETILQSTEKAVAQLASYLGIERTHVESHLGVVGHSLGTAAALQFAVRHPVERIVLIAPFTSLRDMACRVVGIPLCYLLLHHYDNRARLSELAARETPPAVTIIHGDNDSVVPVAMGRALSRMFPHMVTYLEIQNGDHNSVLSVAEPQIFAAMGIVL